MITLAQLALLKTELEKRGHDQFYVGFECGLVKSGNHKDISDDTANIISSVKYLNKKDSFAKREAS